MTIGMWVAFFACLVGVAYQLMAIEGKSGNDVMEAASGRRKGESGRHGSDTEVVRSTQMREVSERKVLISKAQIGRHRSEGPEL